jgi:hypothetical protein
MQYDNVIALAFLFNHNFISFGYKMKHEFWSWVAPINKFRIQLLRSYFYMALQKIFSVFYYRWICYLQDQNNLALMWTNQRINAGL